MTKEELLKIIKECDNVTVLSPNEFEDMLLEKENSAEDLCNDLANEIKENGLNDFDLEVITSEAGEIIMDFIDLLLATVETKQEGRFIPNIEEQENEFLRSVERLINTPLETHSSSFKIKFIKE